MLHSSLPSFIGFFSCKGTSKQLMLPKIACKIVLERYVGDPDPDIGRTKRTFRGERCSPTCVDFVKEMVSGYGVSFMVLTIIIISGTTTNNNTNNNNSNNSNNNHITVASCRPHASRRRSRSRSIWPGTSGDFDDY